MFTLIKKMFLTVIIAMVTVSANAQTDETRAQGWYDFYQAVLADTSSPVTYYADGDLMAQTRSVVLADSLAPSGLLATPHRVLNTATAFNVDGAGRTQFIESTTDAVGALFTTHLTGKIGDTELMNVKSVYFATTSSSAQSLRFGFTDTDIRTRIINALAAGAVAPTVTPPDTTALQNQLATAQAEVMRLTTALSNRPTQAQLNAANAPHEMPQSHNEMPDRHKRNLMPQMHRLMH